MSDVEILRYILGGIGFVLIVMLFWFGRSDKKNNKKNYKSFRESTLGNEEGAEPFLSDESFNLDLNEKEIRALAHSVENNRNSDNLFEDVDAFYENVVKDQEKVRDGITPMTVEARKPATPASPSSQKDQQKPVSVPAWLKDDKPEVQEQVQEQNEPRKIDTVGLFKTDAAADASATVSSPATEKTPGAVPVHASQSQGNQAQTDQNQADQNQDDQEDSPRHSGILPLSSLVNRDRESRKRRNPYLEGFQKRGAEQEANTEAENRDEQVAEIAKPAESQPAEEIGEMPLAANAGSANDTGSVVVNSGPGYYNGDVAQVGGDAGAAKPVISVDEAFLEQQQLQDQDIRHAARSGIEEQAPGTSGNSESEKTRPVQPRRIEKHQANFDITFYLVAGSNHNYTAAEISKAAEAEGLVLVGNDTWSRTRETGTARQYIFSVTAHEKECTFDGSEGSKTTSAIVFEVNAAQNMVSRAAVLDSMIKTARNMERELGGELVDIGHCKITDLMVTHLRRQVEEHDRKLSH